MRLQWGKNNSNRYEARDLVQRPLTTSGIIAPRELNLEWVVPATALGGGVCSVSATYMCSGCWRMHSTIFSAGSSPMQILCTAVNRGNLGAKVHHNSLLMFDSKERENWPILHGLGLEHVVNLLGSEGALQHLAVEHLNLELLDGLRGRNKNS